MKGFAIGNTRFIALSRSDDLAGRTASFTFPLCCDRFLLYPASFQYLNIRRSMHLSPSVVWTNEYHTTELTGSMGNKLVPLYRG